MADATLTRSAGSGGGEFPLVVSAHAVARIAGWPIETVQDFADPELAAAADTLLAAEMAVAATREEYEEAFDRAMEAQRDRLRDHAGPDRFRTALAIANPAVARQWGRGEDRRDKARVRRREDTVLRYLLRSAGRPTPHGLWAGVAEVHPAETEDGVHATPTDARSLVVPDLDPFATTLEALADRQPYASDVPLRVAPTVRFRENGSEWFARGAAIRLPDDAVTSALLRAWSDGRSRPARPVVEQLTDRVRGAESTEQITRTVTELLQLGVLVSTLRLRPCASAWSSLEEASDLLRDGDRERWDDSVQTLRVASVDLEAAIRSEDADAVLDLGDRARDTVRELWEHVGIDGLPDRALRVDLRSPFCLRWGPNEIELAKTTVGELMGVLAADGNAERFRRTRIRSVRECDGTADSVSDCLYGHLAPGRSAGLEDGHPDDAPDTVMGAFRAVGADQVTLDEARRAAARWEQLLDPAVAWPTARIPDDRIARAPRPGVGGAVLCMLSGPSRYQVAWGRPEPGAFLIRFVSALSVGDRPPSLSALQDALADVASTGLKPLSVFTSPLNLNAALGPSVVPDRLESDDTPVLRSLTVRWTGDDRPVLSDGTSTYLPLSETVATSDAADRSATLLSALAAAHGWEWLAGGFLALPAERAGWRRLPRVQLPSGSVLSARRWTIEGDELESILDAGSDAARYLAWREVVKGRGLPETMLVRTGTRPDDPSLPVESSSPLCLRAMLGPRRPERLVISELPGRVSDWPVRDVDGKHYLTELALVWFDRSYASSLLEELQ